MPELWPIRSSLPPCLRDPAISRYDFARIHLDSVLCSYTLEQLPWRWLRAMRSEDAE